MYFGLSRGIGPEDLLRYIPSRLYFEFVASVSLYVHFALIFLMLMFIMARLEKSWTVVLLLINPTILIMYTLLTRDAMIALSMMIILSRDLSKLGAGMLAFLMSVLKMQMLPLFVGLYMVAYKFGFQKKLTSQISKILVIFMLFIGVVFVVAYLQLEQSWGQGLEYNDSYTPIFWFCWVYVGLVSVIDILKEKSVSYESIMLAILLVPYVLYVISGTPVPDVTRWLLPPYLISVFIIFRIKKS